MSETQLSLGAIDTRDTLFHCILCVLTPTHESWGGGGGGGSKMTMALLSLIS